MLRTSHQIDAKKVIAWVREHGRAYGLDPTRLFFTGSLFGANLAGLCTLTPNDPNSSPASNAPTPKSPVRLPYGYYGHYFGEAPH